MQALSPKQEAWLQALESGKFAQGECWLMVQPAPEQPARYCCLGVAAEVVGLPKWPVVKSNKFAFQPNPLEERYWHKPPACCSLHEEAVTALQLRGPMGNLAAEHAERFHQAILVGRAIEALQPGNERQARFLGVQCSLAAYNDSGCSFKTIAAAIREVPEAVFTKPTI